MTHAMRDHLSQRRLLAAAALLGALALALGFLIGPAAAETGRMRANAHGGCSLRTLHGNYAGNLSGTSTATGPLALQALVTFNGNGKASAIVTLMTEKQGPARFTSKTTYTLKRNCTGTLVAMRSTGQTVHYDITVTPAASEVQYLQTDPGTVVTGTTKHV